MFVGKKVRVHNSLVPESTVGLPCSGLIDDISCSNWLISTFWALLYYRAFKTRGHGRPLASMRCYRSSKVPGCSRWTLTASRDEFGGRTTPRHFSGCF